MVPIKEPHTVTDTADAVDPAEKPEQCVPGDGRHGAGHEEAACYGDRHDRTDGLSRLP
jgi:hypothetical protein